MNQITEIVAILLGLLSVGLSVSSFILAYGHGTSSAQTPRRDSNILPRASFFLLSLAVLIFAIVVILNLIPDFSQAALWIVIAFAIASGVFVSNQIYQLRPEIASEKSQLSTTRRSPERLNEKRPEVYQRHKDAMLRNIGITTIQVFGMLNSMPVQSRYIKLKAPYERMNLSQSRRQRMGQRRATLPPFLGNHTAPEIINKSSMDFSPRDPVVLIGSPNFYRWMVLADPGAGKTTLLKYLACLSAETPLKQEGDNNLPPLPVFVSLHDFASSFASEMPAIQELPDLLEFIYKNDLIDEEMHHYFKSALDRGEVLLLLDGLDETFIGDYPQDCYNHVLDAILVLARKYTRLKMVVTVRKSTYYQLGSEKKTRKDQLFRELELSPFEPGDIRRFVDNWQETQRPANFDASVFLRELSHSPSLRALAKNPLFLLLMLFVYQDERVLALEPRLPLKQGEKAPFKYESYAEIYKRCSRSFPVWDASRGIQRPTQLTEDDYKLLEEIAYHFHELRQEQFKQEDLLRFIDTKRPGEAETFLSLMATESGLLKRNETGMYQFLVLKFQEYFAGAYLASHAQLEQQEDFVRHLDNPWWSEVILFYASASSMEHVQPLLEKLFQRYIEENDFFSTSLIVAGRCLAARSRYEESFLEPGRERDERAREVDVRGQIIDALLRLLRETPYTKTRNEVARVLVDIAGDADEEIWLADELKRLYGESNREPSDSLWQIRQSLAYGMAKTGRTALALDFFVLLCSGDENERLAQCLGRLNYEDVVNEMLDELNAYGSIAAGDDEVLHVQQNMIVALSYTHEPEIARLLLKKLTNGTITNRALLEALVKALKEMNESSLAKDLCALLENPKKVAWLNATLLRNIALILGNLDNLEVTEDLLNLLGDENVDRSVCRGIAVALGDLNNKAAIKRLYKYYDSYQDGEEQTLHNYIALALCRLGETNMVKHVLPLLLIEGELGERTAEALGPIEEERVNIQAAFLDVFKNESAQFSSEVRAAVARTVGKEEPGWQEGIELMLKLLLKQDQDQEVRKAIAEALGHLHHPTLVHDAMTTFLSLLQKPGDLKSGELVVQQQIIKSIEKIALKDEEEYYEKYMEKLATLLNNTSFPSELKDSAQHALWKISKDLPRVQVTQGKQTDVVQIVKLRPDTGRA